MILLRLLEALAAVLLLPPLLLLNAASLALVDLAWLVMGRGRPSGQPVPPPAFTRPESLSVVIPSWNGRELLEKFLPSVVEAAAVHPHNEVIVVDNASDDGTAEMVRGRFPSVRLLRMESNLGFGGGNNAGVAAARNGVVVVLNNDMRVEPDAFERLLEGFTDAGVFAVSAQIFFLDQGKRREETGLTEGRFEGGFFRFGHLIEDVSAPYPTFYAGGGSTAYDRAKFLELGGFDRLFHPFYVEDADLSYNAWKRGWQVLYQPRAVVHHEHRATIGKRFSPERIDAIVKKNHTLMVWKNIHCWSRLAQHFLLLYANTVLSPLATGATQATLPGYLGALRGWGRALARRWTARSLAAVDDAEALRRPFAAFYRDRFLLPAKREEGHPAAAARDGEPGGLPAGPAAADPDSGRPLRILFLSPYSLYPPTHGGGVFMYQTVRALALRHEVHVLAFVDRPEEVETNRALERHVRSVECVLRDFPPHRDFHGLTPYSVRCFQSPEFQRRVHRLIWERQIDLVQVEYTQLGHFAGGWRHTPTVLFEHDVYFQSVRRAMVQALTQPMTLPQPQPLVTFLEMFVEWLRALRYELRLLRRMDLVQTCSEKERRLLESFLGPGAPPIRGSLRTAVDTADYVPVFRGRQPETLLFVGNFRHPPNLAGLRFLVNDVLPALRAARPGVDLMVVGAYPTPEVESLCRRPGVRLLGMVPEIREVLSRYALFLSPIFSGSGVRVKILEAFAAGIPVISTPLGAEGLDVNDGGELLLAHDARQFISVIIELLENPERAEALARRARRTTEERWDWDVVLKRLEQAYREALRAHAPAPAENHLLVAASPRIL